MAKWKFLFRLLWPAEEDCKNMIKKRNKKIGFTLLETTITVAIILIISGVLSGFYVNYYRIYHRQQSIFNMVNSASLAANDLQNLVLQASQIITSHSFSGNVYSTDSDTLVLEIPSVDSSGNIISGTYDYVAFYATGTSFYKLIEANAASDRTSEQKRLSNVLSSAVFTYNNTDLSLANKIETEMHFQTTAGGNETISYSLQPILYLRNF
jgi:Tfp pilus assembly protein PilE